MNIGISGYVNTSLSRRIEREQSETSTPVHCLRLGINKSIALGDGGHHGNQRPIREKEYRGFLGNRLFPQHGETQHGLTGLRRSLAQHPRFACRASASRAARPHYHTFQSTHYNTFTLSHSHNNNDEYNSNDEYNNDNNNNNTDDDDNNSNINNNNSNSNNYDDDNVMGGEMAVFVTSGKVQ
ncbi:hypothetical protein ANTRET_LOCUS5226 [Anthophora retusa]